MKDYVGGFGTAPNFLRRKSQDLLVHFWGVVIRLFAVGDWRQTVLVYLVVAVSRSEVP